MNETVAEKQRRVCLTFPPLVRARFVDRENRFRVRVRIDQTEDLAYLANPGRLKELLIPGQTVWLSPAMSPARKTDYNLTLIEHRDILVSLDSHLPNRLMTKALRARLIPGLEGFHHVESEVPLGKSRLDFLLKNDEGARRWVEVKSVTLVNERVAQFPDAPTQRGRRHLRELIDVVEQGDRASVLFVVQREDAVAFSPHDQTDPGFGELLRAAAAASVEVRAFRCNVSLARLCLDDEIPTSLDRQPGQSYNLT